jgi:hypothetical protein
MSSVVPDPATTDWIPLWNSSPVAPPTQPSARVYRTATFACASGAWTTIPFQAVRWDSGPSSHWSSGQPTRLTCQVAGTYVVNGLLQYAAGAPTGGSGRLSQLLVNGGTFQPAVGGQQSLTYTAGGGVLMPITTVLQLNVGDYIELQAYQDSGSSINLSTPGSQYGYVAELAMALVGGLPGPPGIGIPTPVVNGQWIKGSGGAAIWSPIAATDFPQALDANAAGYTDLNNLKQTGWWWLNTNVTNTPVAGMSGGFVQVYAANWNANYVKQIVYTYTDTQRWERTCNGGTWSAWQKTEGPGSIAWYGPYSVDSGGLSVGGYTHSAITHNLGTYPFVLGHIEDKNWGITLNWAANHTLGANQTGIYIYCGSGGGAPAGTNRGIWHGYFGVGNVSAQ